ncbi:hypothetical protein [Vibrio coralliilyticus]|uniref:Uncharacterized protein n=1 Tax=Vibrio coralliilyticus TaxID=190893 RepID=A0AAP7DEL5_9VIBR|nr:hypothetical protein [Vibrio coralliilyticus]NOI32244.1 hypothetical protein [Vibrio coralliilyticus]NOJ25328.1 hypothetical protein [Vibrio coralliilyticus]
MFNNQTLTAVALCAIVYTMSTVAESAAQLVAMLVLVLVPVTIAYGIVRAGKFFVELVSSKKSANVPIQKTCERKMNKRVANARKARAISGDEVMQTPAYLRKQTNRCFPMQSSMLDGYIVSSES